MFEQALSPVRVVFLLLFTSTFTIACLPDTPTGRHRIAMPSWAMYGAPRVCGTRWGLGPHPTATLPEPVGMAPCSRYRFFQNTLSANFWTAISRRHPGIWPRSP